jgi:hypothetical protein
MKRLLPRVVAHSLLLIPLVSGAQWLTQSVPLQPGWNAVHLEVKPEPGACDLLFANLPIESVWKWNRRFSAIQYTTDPSTLLPEDPDWLVWLPPADPRSFLSRLYSLQANQSYLIKVSPDAGPITLSVKGKVVIPRHEWFPHGLNLLGFPVNAANPPTFSDFFKYNPEVDTSRGIANELYRLNSAGRGERVVQPNRDRLQPGVAYWVQCRRPQKAVSAIDVSAYGNAIDFGSTLHTRDLKISNTHPTETLSVRVRQRDSESAPATGSHPELAGPVPLSYLARNSSNQLEWLSLPADGLPLTLAPGEHTTLRLGLRRSDLAPYTASGTNGATYQSILEVTDERQSLMIRAPVVASPAPGDSLAYSENAGLWVGAATLNRVNAPAYTGSDTLPTPAPMSIRLIVHVDEAGQARLLQEVILAWDPGLNEAPHTNGTYALYAREQVLAAAASEISRISSAAFPVMAPVLLSGALTNELTGVVDVPFDSPFNPFLHRYHPSHDNRDRDFVPYTNAVETPDISRSIRMTVAPPDPGAVIDAGTDAFSGAYSEIITGLRAQPVHLEGSFALRRISHIAQLQGLAP